jgi:hypothetical protein
LNGCSIHRRLKNCRKVHRCSRSSYGNICSYFGH